ncbi:MAG: hypothetical protein KAX30_09780 [Candidatus Atribacteria bacterium]|nr:hypothetical protein [Candidatus Atribacteria bacterium]
MKMKSLSILGLTLLVLVMIGGSVVFAENAIVEGPAAQIGRYKAWCTVAEFEGSYKLFIFGGDDLENKTPTEVYDFATGEWSIMGEDSWPPAGENSAIVTVDNKIFAFAGENEDGFNKKAYLYDIEDGEWEELPGEATMGHSDGAVAVVGKKVYVIGGESEGLANEGFDYASAVDVYDTETNRWEIAAPLPLPRQDTFVVSAGTKVYILGGQGANETDAQTANVMILDTVKNEWSEGPDLPYAWEHPRAASVDGKIYIMTGKGEGGYYIFELDPEVDEWKEMASYNLVTRYGSGIAAYDGKIYVACGKNMTGDYLKSIEVYTPALDSYVE